MFFHRLMNIKTTQIKIQTIATILGSLLPFLLMPIPLLLEVTTILTSAIS